MNLANDPTLTPKRGPLVSQRLWPWVVAAMLTFGVEVSLNISPNFGFASPLQGRLVAAVLLLALIPFTARPIARMLDRFGHAGPGLRRVVMILLFAGTTALLFDAARIGKRDLSPKIHDEFSYALQARMLASGRLWMPAHQEPDFFDSFQVIVEPVYCSMYFPGTAVLLVPGVWFHWPNWLTELMVFGGCVAMTYYVVGRLVNGVAGFLAALIVLENDILHYYSIRILSNGPVLLYGLCALAAWICWSSAYTADRRRQARGWAIVTGLMLGLAGITRPLDALCFILPVGSAMAVTIWRGAATASRPSATFVARCVGLGALVFIGMSPSLTVQLIFDKGVTGSFFRTPFDLYADRDYPQTSFGFHKFDPMLYPKSAVPEKQARPAQHTWGFVRDHTPLHALKMWIKRIPAIASDTVDDPFILSFVPLGLLALRGRQWAMGSVPILFPVLYYFYTFYFPHYAIVLIPSMALIAAVGINEVPHVLVRGRQFAQVLLALGVTVLCITDLPELYRPRLYGVPETYPQTRRMDDAVASLPPGRAIVLFRFVDGNRTEEEPVHNETVLTPDDARVIRAQDLGHRDIDLFRYYARIQPDRVAYIYNRGSDTLIRLGRVDDLANRGWYDPTDNVKGNTRGTR